MLQEVMQDLRNLAADEGNPAQKLAAELAEIRREYAAGDLSAEDYQYLLNEIIDVRAQADLAQDEVACRWVIFAAQTLLSAV